MKAFNQLKGKIKRYLKRRRTPAIRLNLENPWHGEKWVRVLAGSTARKIVGVWMFVVLLAACTGSASEPGTLPNTGSTQESVVATGDAALKAVEAAVAQLSQNLNLTAADIQVQAVERVEWPDACLGLNQPNEACAQVVTPGYRILLQANGQQYEFHTNESGSQIRQK